MDEKPAFDSSSLITLNYDVFKQEVLDDKEIVLIAFMVDWSGPSQILDQILEKLDDDVRERTKILKIDASQNKDLASALSISTFPSLVFFKQGEIADVLSGLVSQKDVSTRITNLLNI